MKYIRSCNEKEKSKMDQDDCLTRNENQESKVEQNYSLTKDVSMEVLKFLDWKDVNQLSQLKSGKHDFLVGFESEHDELIDQWWLRQCVRLM